MHDATTLAVIGFFAVLGAFTLFGLVVRACSRCKDDNSLPFTLCFGLAVAVVVTCAVAGDSAVKALVISAAILLTIIGWAVGSAKNKARHLPAFSHNHR
jgi:hypothetical protein